MATWSNIATLTYTNTTTADGSTGFSAVYYDVKLGATTVAAAIRGGSKDGNDYAIELGSRARVATIIGITGSSGWAGSNTNYTATRHYWTGAAWSTRSSSTQTLVHLWST